MYDFVAIRYRPPTPSDVYVLIYGSLNLEKINDLNYALNPLSLSKHPSLDLYHFKIVVEFAGN